MIAYTTLLAWITLFAPFGLWIYFTILVAIFADRRGRDSITWGLWALFFSPVLAWFAVLALRDLSCEKRGA